MKVKELKHGDQVKLQDGSVATIISCKKSAIIESAPGNGGAYEIEWTDGKETGSAIASGEDILAPLN